MCFPLFPTTGRTMSFISTRLDGLVCVGSLRPNRAFSFIVFLLLFIMTYDFNALYQDYLSDPVIQDLGYTSLEDFHIQVTGIVNDRLDDGLTPDPQDVWLMEYMDNAIVQDPEWYITNALA